MRTTYAQKGNRHALAPHEDMARDNPCDHLQNDQEGSLQCLGLERRQEHLRLDQVACDGHADEDPRIEVIRPVRAAAIERSVSSPIQSILTPLRAADDSWRDMFCRT